MARSLLRALATVTPRRPRARRRLDGLMVVPCEGDHADLCVLWDPAEEQIVEVLPRAAAAFGEEDEYWLEARHPEGALGDWRAAA